MFYGIKFIMYTCTIGTWINFVAWGRISCTVYDVNPSNASPVYVRDPNLVITVSADAPAPDGARPSADTGLTGKVIMFIFMFLWHSMFRHHRSLHTEVSVTGVLLSMRWLTLTLTELVPAWRHGAVFLSLVWDNAKNSLIQTIKSFAFKEILALNAIFA